MVVVVINGCLTLAVCFYFYAHLLRLGINKPPRSLLRETPNLFLFNCEPERFDHGDIKNSNFEDDRQPEIAIWPSSRKYVYPRKYDRCHQNFNGKFGIFDNDKLEKMQQSDCDSVVESKLARLAPERLYCHVRFLSSQSPGPGDTIIELAMVDIPDLLFEFRRYLSYKSSDISISVFSPSYRYFRLSAAVEITCRQFFSSSPRS